MLHIEQVILSKEKKGIRVWKSSGVEWVTICVYVPAFDLVTGNTIYCEMHNYTVEVNASVLYFMCPCQQDWCKHNEDWSVCVEKSHISERNEAHASLCKVQTKFEDITQLETT